MDGDLISCLDELQIPDSNIGSDSINSENEMSEGDSSNHSKIEKINQLNGILSNFQESQLSIRDDNSLSPQDRTTAAMKSGVTTAYIRYLDGVRTNLNNVDSETTDRALNKIANAAKKLSDTEYADCFHGLETPQEQLQTAKDVYTKASNCI